MLDTFILHRICGTNMMLADLNKSYLDTAIFIIEGIYSGDVDIRQELVDKFINKFGGLDSVKSLAEEVRDIIYIEEKDLPKFQTIADFIGCFNNTILFRDFKIKSGRNISMINPRIKGRYLEAIVLVHKSIEKLLSITLQHRSSVLPSNAGGTMRNKQADSKSASVFMPGADNNYVIKMDISKFYDSVKTSNFLKHDIFRYINPISNEFYKLLDVVEEGIINPYHDIVFFRGVKCHGFTFFNDLDDYSGYVDIKQAIHTNRLVAIFMLSYLMHNNKIPTGAIYSSSLANLYLLSVDIDFCKKFDFKIRNSESNSNLALITDAFSMQYFRFMDDVTITAFKEDGLAPFDIVKAYERIVNKYGLHLKYSKTSIHDMQKSSNIPILGYTYRLVNGNNLRFLESKYRKEILDIIRSGGYNDFDHSKKGKLAYAMSAEASFKDIALHYNYDEKLRLFNSDKLKFEFGDKIYNIKFEGLHIKDIINSVKDSNFPGFSNHGSWGSRYAFRRMQILRKNMAIRYIIQFMMSDYLNKPYRIIDVYSDKSDPNGNGIRVKFAHAIFKRWSMRIDSFRIPFFILDKMKIEESTLNEGDILIPDFSVSILSPARWNIDNYKVEGQSDA